MRNLSKCFLHNNNCNNNLSVIPMVQYIVYEKQDFIRFQNYLSVHQSTYFKTN